MPHPTYALLSLGEATIDDSAFAHRTARLGGALGTAVATHVVVVVLVWALAALRPAEQASKLVPASSLPSLVFIDATGAGARSGGEGGGNRSALAAVLVRTRPADAMAVPITRSHPLTAPDAIAPEAMATNAWDLPVNPMDAGTLPQVGAIDGLPSPPTNARGAGEGQGTDLGRGPGSGPGNGPGRGPGGRGGGGDDVYGIGNGVTAPQILFQTSPRYTPEAVRAKLQGVAVVSAVVAPDGRLRDVRIVRSLDATFGLDQEAISCVRQWRFTPGTRQGAPVAVYVTIEVAFTLR